MRGIQRKYRLYWMVRLFMSFRIPGSLRSIRWWVCDDKGWCKGSDGGLAFVPRRTFQRWVSELMDLGIVKRNGAGRTSTYELSDAAREVLDAATRAAGSDLRRFSEWNLAWDARGPLHPEYERAIVHMLRGGIRARARELEGAAKSAAIEARKRGVRRSKYARHPWDDVAPGKSRPKRTYCRLR